MIAHPQTPGHRKIILLTRSRVFSRLSGICLAPLLVLLSPLIVNAQEPIRFARTPDLSPDGKLIAFSYLGDIWTVEAIGGVARPVTMHEAHDINPVFSPDGKWIAFSSNRHGSYDVFVVPAVGGKPRRLTFDSAPDMVTGWTPDGKNVVFSSSRSNDFPPNIDSYIVPVQGGPERRLPLFEGKEAHFAPVGDRLAFVRGPGLWYRRGYRGSSNDDIWLSNADGTSQKQFTTFEGQDASPMWSPDAKRLYYVSEQGSKPGCANIIVREIASGMAAESDFRRLTTHADESVRRARISANGEWIVYECGADLWVVGTRSGSSPRKLAIEVNADDKSNTERTTTFTKDATEFALNADEDAAVLTVQGELFLIRLPEGGKATRLTDSPAFDHGASFSPDGKSILFLSDRTGHEDIYLLQPDDAERPELNRANKFKVKQLTDTPEGELGATFSPKGDRIAFLRSGKLWTMKPDGSEPKVLVHETQVFDYDWSPDGKMIVFARSDGSFASELFIVPTDGSAEPKNITRYATYNGDVSWSRSGGKIGFISQRRGIYAPHVLSLQRPGIPGGASEIDWDDIQLRVERPTAMSAEDVAISPNGQQIAFRHSTSGDDLWVASSNGSSVTRVTLTNQAPRNIHWSRKSSGMIYFLNGAGELRTIRVSSPYGLSLSSYSSEPVRVNFQAKMTVKRAEEYAEMFVQCWRALSDQFYDAKYHGADWEAIRARYQPLVAHVAQKEDLYALISLMLGELNASHLGISGRLPYPDEVTADLGLIFDESYRGPGLKVAEVLKRGPADKRGLAIKAGDVILAIDRVELAEKTNISQLLNNKVGESVLLDVSENPKDPQARHRVEITAADRNRSTANMPAISQLMYERWVRRNAEAVAKASGGKVGYIHIPSMDEAGLEVFVRALYSDHFDKDAIVLDVRYNGGGFTHDQVLNYLAGKEHTFFRQRDGGEGLVMRSHDRKWTKPLVVLTNNRSYSDAEIFPHAFRTLGLGKVVGQATGGFVIGTYSTQLIDGSSFRLPRTGVFTNKGVNMEKQGVIPDVAVDISPEDWAKGIDTQILKAVEVVSSDVREWKAKKSSGPTLGGTAAPALPTGSGSGGGSNPAPKSTSTPAPGSPSNSTSSIARIPLAE
jgi:tricorn protease